MSRTRNFSKDLTHLAGVQISMFLSKKIYHNFPLFITFLIIEMTSAMFKTAPRNFTLVLNIVDVISIINKFIKMENCGQFFK